MAQIMMKDRFHILHWIRSHYIQKPSKERVTPVLGYEEHYGNLEKLAPSLVLISIDVPIFLIT